MYRSPAPTTYRATGHTDIAIRVDIARRVWREAGSIAGTLGERYLRETRRIDARVLPPTLRFHPSLVYGQKRHGLTFPGIVCSVCSANGDFSGIWRIFLDQNTADKASIPVP